MRTLYALLLSLCAGATIASAALSAWEPTTAPSHEMSRSRRAALASPAAFASAMRRVATPGLLLPGAERSGVSSSAARRAPSAT